MSVGRVIAISGRLNGIFATVGAVQVLFVERMVVEQCGDCALTSLKRIAL